MPTLTWLDSFEHQYNASQEFGTNAGIWDTNNTSAGISFVTGRRSGSHAMQVAENGVGSTRVGKQIAAGNRTLVESFYFMCSAAPSVNSIFWQALATINASLNMDTSGHITWNAGTGTAKVSAGTYNDGAWHRIDLKWVTSATPYTLDIYIDGVSQIQQVSGATTAADITETRFGSNNAAHTMTFAVCDWVRSVTAGDYPIGPHECRFILPTADGTHSWSATHFGDETANRNSSDTQLWTHVDEWPASATDYILGTTNATGAEYAEIVMGDIPSDQTIVWAARAVIAMQAGGTAANAWTARLVNDSGTLILNLLDNVDISETALRYNAALLPGIDTQAEVNSIRWRLGFPTDASPSMQAAALLVDYAIFNTGAAALSGAGTSTISGFKTKFGAATITGLGSMLVAGVRKTFGAATLAGLGSSTISAFRNRMASASLTGLGSSTIAGVRTAIAAASLTGLGAATVAGVRTAIAAAALAGAGVATASATAGRVASAALAGTGSTIVAGVRKALGAGTLTGTGSSTVSGIAFKIAAAILSGIGSLIADGRRRSNQDVNMTMGKPEAARFSEPSTTLGAGTPQVKRRNA